LKFKGRLVYEQLGPAIDSYELAARSKADP